MSIRVGHVVLLEKKKGEYQDFLVLSVEDNTPLILGVIDLQTHIFKFINLYEVKYLFTRGIQNPETVNEEGVFKVDNLITPAVRSEQIFKRGDEVSFCYLEQGAELTIKGYYLDVSDKYKNHCLISEKGTSVRRWWEVPFSMLTLLSRLVERP